MNPIRIVLGRIRQSYVSRDDSRRLTDTEKSFFRSLSIRKLYYTLEGFNIGKKLMNSLR